MLSKFELEAIAQLSAMGSLGEHDYLPKTEEEAATFQPHKWVRNAMHLAYELGSAKAGVPLASSTYVNGVLAVADGADLSELVELSEAMAEALLA